MQEMRSVTNLFVPHRDPDEAVKDAGGGYLLQMERTTQRGVKREKLLDTRHALLGHRDAVLLEHVLHVGQ